MEFTVRVFLLLVFGFWSLVLSLLAWTFAHATANLIM